MNCKIDQITQLWRSATSFGMRLRVYTDLRRPPNMSPFDWHPEAMFLDTSCPDADKILHKVSLSRAFNYRHSWLLLHNVSYDRTIVEKVLKPYEILPDADVVWSTPNNLVDAYRIKAKHPYILTELGLDRNCSRHDLSALWRAWPTTVSRRNDLRNVTIPGATVITLPELFRGWEDVSMRQIDTFPKFTYRVMMVAAEDLNIKYNLRQVDLYGYPMNGSYSGVSGLLQRQEVEICLASIFMRTDRMVVMHFVAETLPFTSAFIFRQPPRSAVSNVFLVPFSSGVWLSCGLVVLLVALSLILLRKVRQMTLQSTPELLELLTPMTVLETWTFVLGTMCQQGFHITPPISSVRLVMFSTLLTSLFLFTSYSANIVTLLQTPSKAIRTIDDLTKSPMTIAELDSTYKKVYFAESIDPATQRLYRRKFLPQGDRAYIPLFEGMERIRTELFAFSVERCAAYDVIRKTYTEREKCALDEIESFKAPMVGIPIKRHSGYRELFAVRLRWQREVGLLDQARRVWIVSRPKCESKSGDFVSVGIVDVLPALQALALGALISIALLGVELALYAVKNKAIRRT